MKPGPISKRDKKKNPTSKSLDIKNLTMINW